jgi:hypothetical protein
MENEFVPKQEKGGKLDIRANLTLASEEEAEIFFEVVKKRLFNINGWDEVCMVPSSTFKLINRKNQEIIGTAKEGDYIRINIPGPGTKIGEGFDWVNIESILEHHADHTELWSITVRPCSHPLKPKELIAHFFSPMASSTFQAKRVKNKIYTAVHGRNEVANNKIGSLLDRLRNTMVAFGAKIGFSYPQWKLLAEGLLRK